MATFPLLYRSGPVATTVIIATNAHANLIARGQGFFRHGVRDGRHRKEC